MARSPQPHAVWALLDDTGSYSDRSWSLVGIFSDVEHAKAYADAHYPFTEVTRQVRDPYERDTAGIAVPGSYDPNRKPRTVHLTSQWEHDAESLATATWSRIVYTSYEMDDTILTIERYAVNAVEEEHS